MNKEKKASLLRQGAIVVLLITAALLLGETGYFDGLRELLPISASESRPGEAAPQNGQTQKPTDAVRPLTAVVCGSGGGRYGAAYHDETTMAVFRRFSADLGEALGSAGAPVGITETEFCSRLRGSGVFFGFHCAQPLELLSGWLGTEMSGEAAGHRVQLLFLCAAGEQTELCYRTETGEFFACATAAPAAGLSGRTEEYLPDGSCFAFECGKLSAGDALTVIPAGQATAAVVKSAAVNPGEADIEELMRGVGMNSYVANSYTEADGTTVYVDETATLRVRADGSIAFRRTALPVNMGHVGLTGNVNSAWQIAERCIGKNCGDAVLLFAGLGFDSTPDNCTVYLDYAVNGIPVRLASGHAAEIVVRFGSVVQLRLNCRTYTATEETKTLLPMLQAAAIAAQRDAEPKLIYADRSDATDCIWVTD